MKPAISSLRVLTMLFGLIFFAACTAMSDSNAVQDLSAPQFRQMLDRQPDDGDVVLLDIRTPGEYRSGHIQGALLVDYYASDFVDKLKALDREKTYLVYCRSGNRSGKSLSIFKQLGFRQVYHLRTGIRGWQQEKYPLTR